MNIPKIELPEKEEKSGREFHTFESEELRASQIRLIEPTVKETDPLWCVRFALDITQPEPDQVNAFYVKGILNSKGDWIADFVQPTEKHLTTF